MVKEGDILKELFPAGIFITLIFNIAGFFIMGYDKKMAGKGKWRIPEKTLIIISVSGGAVGVMLGMKHFRHKTRHALFVYGMPFLVLFNLAVFFYIYRFLL